MMSGCIVVDRSASSTSALSCRPSLPLTIRASNISDRIAVSRSSIAIIKALAVTSTPCDRAYRTLPRYECFTASSRYRSCSGVPKRVASTAASNASLVMTTSMHSSGSQVHPHSSSRYSKTSEPCLFRHDSTASRSAATGAPCSTSQRTAGKVTRLTAASRTASSRLLYPLSRSHRTTCRCPEPAADTTADAFVGAPCSTSHRSSVTLPEEAAWQKFCE
mmetsp:Transcript_14985/g.46896  ORF Transcript_14985/g.46896 Transcript_14985/m.46896 type:complete len:219 (+) Transcript_14985:56-712(+)